MEWTHILGVLVILMLAFMVVRRILRHFWLSRVLSVGISGVLLGLAVTLDRTAQTEQLFVLPAALAWQFFLGEGAARMEYTGRPVRRCGTWCEEATGGLLTTTFAALAGMGFLYHCVSFACYVIPILLILLNLLSVIHRKK